MLVALSPENGWEFITAMSEAWAWTQERKRFYCDSGGFVTVEEYLEDAKLPEKRQLAVIHGGRMVSVVTVRIVADGCFEIHVTSQRGVEFGVIREALLGVRDSFFDELNARAITTSCPVYGKHEHKGSRQLAEVCGMKATGETWQSGGATWREYEITRDQFYGQSTTGTDNRLQILPETVLAGA